MFKWWKKWKESRRNKKRHDWEYDQLSEKQKKKYFTSSDESVDIFQEVELLKSEVERLTIKYNTMKELIANYTRKGVWRVIQSGAVAKDRWFKSESISYVSSIYTNGPENAFYFDVVVDGHMITLGFDSVNEAEQYKFDILNVERIEEYDETTQQELFDNN